MLSRPAFIYSESTIEARCDICSKLPIKAPYSSVSIVNFEQVNASWDYNLISIQMLVLAFSSAELWINLISYSHSITKQTNWLCKKYYVKTSKRQNSFFKYNNNRKLARIQIWEIFEDHILMIICTEQSYRNN